MKKQNIKPNVVRGGIAIPLGRNYYYMSGRKHKNGGIDIGENPRTGLEVEDGEVMHVADNEVKVFSSVPFLNGESPAEKVLGGENPTTVFRQQELFKDRNGINDDGTKKNTRTKAKMGTIDWDKVDEYADTAEKTLGAANLGLSVATLAAPNPYTAAGAYGAGLAGIGVDVYQGIRNGIKGNWPGVGKNAVDIGLSLIGMRALKTAKKWNDLNKAKVAAGTPREYITRTIGRNPKNRHKIKVTKELNAAQNDYLLGYSSIPMSTFLNFVDPTKPNNKDNTNNKKAMGGLNSSKDYKPKAKSYSKEGGIYSITVNGKTKMRMLSSTGERTKAPFGIDYELPKVIGINPEENNKYVNAMLAPIDELVSKGQKNYITKRNNPTTRNKRNLFSNIKNPFKSMTGNDKLSLASNIIGTGISTIINASMLNSLKSPNKPIQTPAAKLKTNININPQLDKMRETIANYEQNVDNNTSSSRVSTARKQNARFANMLQTNELYGNKENLETELINKDKLNQQSVAAENVRNYNEWNDKVTAFNNAIAEKKAENYVSLADNINSGIQDVISRNEARHSERQTRLAMAAAHPNVNPRILRALGIEGITDADIAAWEKAFYNKK